MNNREGQVKRIVLSAVDECAVCGHEYVAENIDIIGSRGDLWVFLLRCPSCQKQGFIAALVNGPEMPISLLLPTAERARLADDAEPAAGGAPINARDVLEMREFLSGFAGDLARYLEGDPPRPA